MSFAKISAAPVIIALDNDDTIGSWGSCACACACALSFAQLSFPMVTLIP